MGALAGTGLLGSLGHAFSKPSPGKGITRMKYPWEYKKLEIKKTQARAYENYFKAGCMYGVFEAIAGQVAEQLGEPYTQFPFAMSAYGGGGVALW